MKENDARVEYDRHQVLLYVEKSDGEYGPLQTGSFLTKNYVDDFWEKKKKFTELMRKKLTNGEISPVGYYMLTIEISPAEVASRIGISAGAVKKHQDIKHFRKLNVELLHKYADVFGVTIADMFQIEGSNNYGFSIRQSKTANPFVTAMSVVKEQL